jgi:hypothetical protein
VRSPRASLNAASCDRPSGARKPFNSSPMAHAMGFRSFGPPGLPINPAFLAPRFLVPIRVRNLGNAPVHGLAFVGPLPTGQGCKPAPSDDDPRPTLPKPTHNGWYGPSALASGEIVHLGRCPRLVCCGPLALSMHRASVAAGVPPAVEGGVSPPGIPGSWSVSRSHAPRFPAPDGAEEPEPTA